MTFGFFAYAQSSYLQLMSQVFFSNSLLDLKPRKTIIFSKQYKKLYKQSVFSWPKLKKKQISFDFELI